MFYGALSGELFDKWRAKGEEKHETGVVLHQSTLLVQCSPFGRKYSLLFFEEKEYKEDQSNYWKNCLPANQDHEIFVTLRPLPPIIHRV